MRHAIFAAIFVAAVLSIGAPVNRAAAMTLVARSELGLATSNATLVQKTAVVCSYSGCMLAWPPQHYWGWGWPQAWGYFYRPACPYGYHYACRHSPYGSRQCACWPDY